jgi:hypothetical protein
MGLLAIFYGTFGHYVNPPLSCLVPVDTLYGIRLYSSEHERETKFRAIGVHALVGGSLP